MKKQILIIGIMLVLLTVGLSGCINPEGDWVLHTNWFDGTEYTGNVRIEKKLVGTDCEYTVYDDSSKVLFKGIYMKSSDLTKSKYMIKGSVENLLTISIIFIVSDTYMVSDLPMLESLDPYTFTR